MRLLIVRARERFQFLRGGGRRVGPAVRCLCGSKLLPRCRILKLLDDAVDAQRGAAPRREFLERFQPLPGENLGGYENPHVLGHPAEVHLRLVPGPLEGVGP
jgi:hypothetical protein